MGITWVQSQMVRLMAPKQLSAESGTAPHQLWNDKANWPFCITRANELNKLDLREIAEQFKGKFSFTKDEPIPLPCLACMRNTLAHGAVSLFAMSQQDEESAPLLL